MSSSNPKAHLHAARVLRRRRLAAQHALSRILASATSCEGGVAKILEVLGRSLGADVGELWVPDGTGEVLEHAGLWHAPSLAPCEADLDAWRTKTFRCGVGVPGCVWDLGIAVAVHDIVRDELFARPDVAERLGLRGAVAFPVHFGGTTIGVLQHFFEAESMPADEIIELFADVGGQIGLFLEHFRVRAALG